MSDITDNTVTDAETAPVDAPETVEAPAVDLTEGAVPADELPTEATADAADDATEPAATAEPAAEADAEDEVAEEPAPRRRKSPYDRPGRWYVIHTQSGYENKVRNNLMARTQSMNMEERIFEVVIPMEDVVEFKNGKKQTSCRSKVFPGYLLDPHARWTTSRGTVIRNTPGVTGFVGQSDRGQKPIAAAPQARSSTFLSAKECHRGCRGRPPQAEASTGVPDGRERARQGRPVRGLPRRRSPRSTPISMKLKVLVNIFGRETLVEMDFSRGRQALRPGRSVGTTCSTRQLRDKPEFVGTSCRTQRTEVS